MVIQPLSVRMHSVSVKKRGKIVLGPIDLKLESCGFTIVLGPNGAGKTTLLKVLHGVERIAAGTVEWSLPTAQAQEQQCYVFQRPIMLRRSVWKNLSYPLELLGLPKPRIKTQVAEWAERVGLTEMLDQPAPRLSGGEKQKLALARALIRKPKVLFLDEPCANLDGPATREIEDLLRRVNVAGTRIIMTTHNLGQARRLASDVLFLSQGQLHEQGNARQIFCDPRMPKTQAFLRGDIVE